MVTLTFNTLIPLKGWKESISCPRPCQWLTWRSSQQPICSDKHLSREAGKWRKIRDWNKIQGHHPSICAELGLGKDSLRPPPVLKQALGRTTPEPLDSPEPSVTQGAEIRDKWTYFTHFLFSVLRNFQPRSREIAWCPGCQWHYPTRSSSFPSALEMHGSQTSKPKFKAVRANHLTEVARGLCLNVGSEPF